MRDIPSSNDFNAGGAQHSTKIKLARTSSNSGMGTLTRTDYRSYRDFLTSYTDGKNSKDDQESVSSTDSGVSSSYKLCESKSNNTSTSSLNSEINGTNSKSAIQPEPIGIASRTGSFRNYMDGYTNKKFSSVKPKIAAKQNLIKSEIVIQVNSPGEKIQPKTFLVTVDGDVSGTDSTDSFLPPPPPPQNENNLQEEFAVFCLPPPPPMFLNGHHSEVSNFIPPPPPQSNNHQSGSSCFVPPPPPPKLPNFSKPPSHNGSKTWATVQTEDQQRPNSNQPEKRPANHAAAANLAQILTQHLLPRRKQLEAQEEKVGEGRTSEQNNKIPENGQNGLKSKTVVSVVPKVPQNSPPKAPGFPPQKPFQKTTNVSKRSEITVEAAPKLPETSPPKQPQKVTMEWAVRSPEISRRMECFQQPKLAASGAPKLPLSSPPRMDSGRSSPNGSVDYNTTTVVPIADGSTKVSKNDPNVKKLVYNTYRGLLGAYNNKANDMIATLPRNMVREDQGVSKQLESMALQGGLEKLNGRINPNVEQE